MAEEADLSPVEKALQDTEAITRALGDAVREALRRHKLLGNPVCYSRDGKVVWIPPEEISVD